MVLRGIAVQLNSGLTAPKIGRPLCPARHMPSVVPVSCPRWCPFGHRELNLISPPDALADSPFLASTATITGRLVAR